MNVDGGGVRPISAVVEALMRASYSIVHPIILVIVLLPMLIAAAIWGGVAWFYWDAWTSGIAALLAGRVFTWTQLDLANVGSSWFAAATVIALLVPLIMLSALLIASVFAMPVLVGHVAKTHHPMLARRHGGTVSGSIINAVLAVLFFALLWILSLPLWLLGPVAAMLPLVLSAYVNQRLFRYDALSEHASPEEMQQIFELAGGRLFLLGLVCAVLFFIPGLNLIAPIYAALAFIHLCLEELQRLRAAGQTVPAQAEQ